MRIRPANIGDLERCARIEASFRSEYVWQMEERETPEGRDISFRRVRVPRPVEVHYRPSEEELTADLQRNECFLVADHLGVILGYLDMTVRRGPWLGWIEHLVVHPAYRRQHVATRLLEAAEHWARGSELRAIVIPVQTKNDPALCLLTRRGYSFCGFIDRYYDDSELCLLYALRLG